MVDVKADLAALQELVSKLNLPERGKFERAMQGAVEETGKSEPDKEEVAGALGRIVICKGGGRFRRACREVGAADSGAWLLARHRWPGASCGVWYRGLTMLERNRLA